MTDWVLLQTPSALLLYGVSLLLRLFDRRFSAVGGLLTLLSGISAIFATALLLLFGASLREAATVLLVFLLLNLGAVR